MNVSTKTIKSEIESGSELENSNMKITLKTEGAIKIKSETELPCQSDSDHAGQIETIEQNLKIEKSEYEFQSNNLNWTLNNAEYTDEEDDGDDYNDDNDDYNDDNDDYNDDNHDYNDDNDDGDEYILRDHKKDMNPDIKVSNSNASSGKRDVNSNRYILFGKKRKYLDSYMLRFCPYCNKEFESFTAWNAHLDEVHNHNSGQITNFTYDVDGKAKCVECKTILNTKVDTLKSHILLHLPHRNIYKCRLCSITKFRQIALLEHIEKRHFDVVGEDLSALRGKGSKVCAYCGKYVGVARMISMHIKKEHAGIYEQKLCFICSFCGEQFAEEKCHKEHLLNKHKFNTLEGLSFEIIKKPESHDKKAIYRCLKCNQQVAGRFSFLTYHALIHLPYKCYKCKYCNYTHNGKWKVMKHTCNDLLSDIKNNPSLTAKTKPSNIKYPKINVDIKNKFFVCPKCGENFEELTLWEVHITEVHNFNKIEALNITATAEGENNFRCTICEKKFSRSNIFNFKSHAFIHMPYKLYKCKLCEEPLNSIAVCTCQVEGKAILYVCPQCGSEFNSQGSWSSHTKLSHGLGKPSGLSFSKIFFKENEASYKCSDCGEVIKESEPLCRDLMFKHASIKHMPFKCYKCKRCGESSHSKDIMLEHTNNCKIEMKHITAEDENECNDIAKCQCNACGYLGDSEEIVINHQNDVHQLEKVENYSFTWFCTECEYKYETKEEILEHVLSIHLKKRRVQSRLNFLCFFCPVCNMKFQTHPEWKEHIFKQHALDKDEAFKVEDLGKDWKCLECNIVYSRKRFRKFDHCMRHLPYKSFKCIICSKAFKSQNTAIQHVSTCSSKPKAMHSKKRQLSASDTDVALATVVTPVKRERCKRSNIKNLKKDVNQTTSDPLQIDKSNVQSYSLTSMAISSQKAYAWNKYCKYLIYACPECNMPFDTSEEWHMHISTHHYFFADNNLNISPVPGDRKKRICDDCGVTVHGGLLHAQRHKLTHMPYQAFICKICNHRSKTNNVLMYHIERKHFTSGKFKCALCQLVFETCHDRFEHTNAEHTNAEWPDNACRICMKVLNNKHSLKEHMKTHEFNRKKFECGFCRKNYCHDFERKKHWKQIHPVEFASIVNEEQEKLVVKKPVRKTKKYKKKKFDSESAEDFVSDSSSDSIALSKLKSTKKIISNNTGTIRTRTRSKVNNEETLSIKKEPESSETISMSKLKPSKKRSTNKTVEGKTKIESLVKYEEAIFVNELIFKNEPGSDDDNDVAEEFGGFK